MKSLESIINKYLKSGSAADLPDISTEKYLKVNSTQDGYHHLRQGGHLYLIKQEGTNYSIYAAHNSKVNAVRFGKDKEPKTVDGFYLDDIAVVQTKDNEVYFEEKDKYNPYDIISRISKLDLKENSNLLYAALEAFYAYVLSEYKFSNAYPSNFVPPIEVCTFKSVANASGTGTGTGTGSGNGTTPTPTPTPTPSAQSEDEPKDTDSAAKESK